MSIQFREYREVSRNFLLRVLQKQKEDVSNYPVSLFSNNLENELKEAGFFDKYKQTRWWRQEVCPITLRPLYTPIEDGIC